MEKNSDNDRINSLFAAARKAVFYSPDRESGFESRLLARVRAERKDRPSFLLWAWRLIPAFVSIVILLGIWTYMSESNHRVDLSAVAGIGSEEIMLTAFLTGE